MKTIFCPEADTQNSTPISKQAHKLGMMDDKMMAHCMEMMQKHDQMLADFKAQDAKLDDLVTSEGPEHAL